VLTSFACCARVGEVVSVEGRRGYAKR
jgi:hypothetical protein